MRASEYDDDDKSTLCDNPFTTQEYHPAGITLAGYVATCGNCGAVTYLCYVCLNVSIDMLEENTVICDTCELYMADLLVVTRLKGGPDDF